jgi:dihydropyrimidine dehydrogenase (NAD+) subunit PreA
MAIDKKPDLSVSFCGVKFRNPFLLSSSPVSNSAEMVEMAYEHGWAGVCYKTLNSDRIPIIHPSPRMSGYDYEGKRLVGLQNVEQISDRPLKDNLADFLFLKKKHPDHPIISSIMGFSNNEWAYLAKASEDNGADMLELNFSCPHMTVEGSGHKVGQAFHLLEKFTATVKKAVKIPVLAKMTPNITDMTEPALYAKKGGADGISAVNTFRGISGIGLDDLVPKPNVFGVGAMSGYSGAAIKPIALHFIAEMAKCAELGLPLSAMGGVETWIDSLEYLLVGATTVQVTTGIIKYGYRIVEDMIEGLTDYMTQRGITRATDLIGKALPHLQETDHFDLGRQGVAKYDMDRCIGCGQCYIVCRDAGGQALEWEAEKRRPKLVEDKCLSCMICSFICPVPGLIEHKEMPRGWARKPTAVMDGSLERQVNLQPYPREGGIA